MQIDEDPDFPLGVCPRAQGTAANAAGGPVLINEFMAANSSFFPDPQSQFDDWVELYNAGDAVVDAAGMYLTDDPEVPTKWKIPTNVPNLTRIAAQGYLLVWLDNDTADPGLHASFKLDADERSDRLVRQGRSHVARYRGLQGPAERRLVWKVPRRRRFMALHDPPDAGGPQHPRLRGGCRRHEVQPRPRLLRRAVRGHDHHDDARSADLLHGGRQLASGYREKYAYRPRCTPARSPSPRPPAFGPSLTSSAGCPRISIRTPTSSSTTSSTRRQTRRPGPR